MADKIMRLGVDLSQAESQMRKAANEFSKISDEVNKDSSKASEYLLKAFTEKARSYTTSAKEMLRSIDQQSKDFIQRREQERSQERRYIEDVKAGKVQGVKYTDKDYTRKVLDLKRESEDDRQIIKGLKDIVDAIISTSKNEIVEDRKNVERQISKSPSVNRLFKKGDNVISVFEETIKQDELSRLKIQEDRQKQGFNLGGAAMIGRQVAQGDVGGAMMTGGMQSLGAAMSNPYLLLAAIPLLFGGFSFLQNKKIGEDLREFALSTGQPISNMYGRAGQVSLYSDTEWNKMGLTPVEAMQKFGKYNLAAGNIVDSLFAESILGTELGSTVSSQQISNLLSQSRYSGADLIGGTGVTTTAILNSISNFLTKTNQSQMRMSEVLDTYMTASNNIINKTGEIDAATTMSTIMGIGQSYGVSGVNLNRYTNAFQGAFSRSDNPQIQALQFRVLSEMYPEESLWQLQTRLSDPLSNPEYIKSMMGRLKSMYKGSEQGKFTMLEMFKPYGVSEKDIDKYWNNTYNSAEFDYKDAGFKKKAEELTPAAVETIKEILSTKEVGGAITATTTEDVKNFFESVSFKNILSEAFSAGIRSAKQSDPTLFGN